MFKVKRNCCNQCLFSENKIVDDQRKDEIIKSTWDSSHFICHKASMQWKDVCCKGFYDNVKNQKIQIAERLWVVEMVD